MAEQTTTGLPQTAHRRPCLVAPAPRSEPPLDGTGRPGRVCPAPARPVHRARAASPQPADPDVAPEARRFVTLMLRLVLEVLDRRRAPDQLRRHLDPASTEAVTALARRGAPGRRLGSAKLLRVHLSPSGPSAVEVCATYSRGPRVFALAARAEQVDGAWRCRSLRIA